MKNKINNYDFLIVGAGLIGSLAAINLQKKKYSVLVIDKNTQLLNDERTLAVNANSREFLNNLGIWNKLKSQPEPINKIIIKDYINSSDLIFENKNEDMGSVILNKELLEEARKELVKKKSILLGINIPIPEIIPKKKIKINNKLYQFKNIIFSLGKKYKEESIIKRVSFERGHISHVGFFNHSKQHQQHAYEFFTQNGPLAILPAPGKNKKKSTFIYTTKLNTKKSEIEHLIKKNFKKTHGIINFKNKIDKFEVLPHVSKDISNKYILVGDTLRSIHPVAGQGWNLGIKDLQSLNNLLDMYGMDDDKLINRYYLQRNIDNIGYISFTSSLNYLYENQSFLNTLIVRAGFSFLKNISFLRKGFIKQAMGRLELI